MRGEVLSRYVEKLTMNFVVTCDDEASITAAKSMTYGEELIVAVNFLKG